MIFKFQQSTLSPMNYYERYSYATRNSGIYSGIQPQGLAQFG
jgi:hypothetical protein